MAAQLSYLEAEVLSASGPKLRLMLIEAALRLARQTLPELEEARLEPALQKLARVRKILWELLFSVGETSGDISQNIRRVYTFLIRVVTDAQLSGDPDKVRDLVSILEIERDTWREVNARFVIETASRPSSGPYGTEESPATISTSADGFSVEA